MTSTHKSSHYVFKGLALETFGPLDFRPRDSLMRSVLFLLMNQDTSKLKSICIKESIQSGNTWQQINVVRRLYLAI